MYDSVMVRFFWLILITWVVLRSTLLSLAWNGNPDPQARADVLRFFTEEDLQQGREYVRHGFWAKATSPFVQAAMLLTLMFTGWAAAGFDRLQAMTNGGFWTATCLALPALFFLLQLGSAPFDYCLGFLGEKQMGFSNLTAAQWWLLYAQRTLVSWGLEMAGILLVLWTVRTFDRSWPLLIPVVTTGFGIVVTLLFPLLITPLFYQQKPLAEGPLKQSILQIAAQAKVPVAGIYEIDESRYSKHTNAYFTGLFSQQRIVLYDTLINSHTVDEAALIFAHEVGHWKHDHVLIGMVLGCFGVWLGCILLWIGYPLLQVVQEFHLRELAHPANLPFFLLAMLLGQLFFAPVEAQLSQYFERQADQASLELTGLKQTFIDAEVRLARDNRSELLPHPWRVFWLHSHPPAIERIRRGLDFKPRAVDSTPAPSVPAQSR
ncbi:MAG: M48 family metallopeptidase [Planctomycetota bacterium]|nr:M48 family metallopeptidase [Planctomycetota bacterium]